MVYIYKFESKNLKTTKIVKTRLQHQNASQLEFRNPKQGRQSVVDP